jgi:hypothetical protein
MQGWASCTECVRARPMQRSRGSARWWRTPPHHVGRVHEILLVVVGLADEEHFAVAGHDRAVELAVDGTVELNSITVVGSPRRGCPAAPTNGGLSVADGQSSPKKVYPQI